MSLGSQNRKRAQRFSSILRSRFGAIPDVREGPLDAGYSIILQQ